MPGDRAKNHRALALPLPRQALAALDGRHRIVGRDPLFGRSAKGFHSWSRSKSRLDARLGFANSWDLHDLRRTVQTRLLSLGVSRDLVNKILNHAMGPVDETYDQHDYLIEKSVALQRWADEIERIVESGPGRIAVLLRK